MQKKFHLICTILLALTAIQSSAAKLRVGYLYPALEYDSENSLKWIAKQMETKFGAKNFFFQGKDLDEGSSLANPTIIANINELDSLDVLVIFVRRVWLNSDQLQKLRAFMDGGKGLVGIRTASHAVESWDAGRGMDSAIWGGAYNGHGAKNGYDLEFTPEATSDPIFKDVQTWQAGNSLYFQNYPGRSLAPDIKIMQYGKSAEGRYPVTWTRSRKGSNIFFTSTGVQSDFQNPEFQKMILNAVRWAGNALVGTGGLIRKDFRGQSLESHFGSREGSFYFSLISNQKGAPILTKVSGQRVNLTPKDKTRIRPSNR